MSFTTEEVFEIAVQITHTRHGLFRIKRAASC